MSELSEKMGRQAVLAREETTPVKVPLESTDFGAGAFSLAAASKVGQAGLNSSLRCHDLHSTFAETPQLAAAACRGRSPAHLFIPGSTPWRLDFARKDAFVACKVTVVDVARDIPSNNITRVST